jgi:lysozyme family protein
MITQLSFEQNILPFVLKHEGGYANVKGDRGGETYRGISRVHNPAWIGWKTIDRIKPLKHNQIVKALEYDVKRFYWDKYFNRLGFNLLNSTEVALVLFDWAVNGGYTVAKITEVLNKRFGFKLSGGSFTACAKSINSINAGAFNAEIIKLREQHYNKIINNNPTQAKFKKAWFARLGEVKNKVVKPFNIGLFLAITAIIIIIIIVVRKRSANNEQFNEPNNDPMENIGNGVYPAYNGHSAVMY